MLSAQTKDAVTAAASARLFRVARTPKSMAKLTHAQIQKLIYPVSFYRHKAVHVQETCRADARRVIGGRVPSTMEELLTLPGVGRKTANLVLILAHSSQDNICVDTHVHRISNRLGWVKTTDAGRDRTGAVPRGRTPLVAGDQSVSGDVGAERLPPGISFVPAVRARRTSVRRSASPKWARRSSSREGRAARRETGDA